MGLEGEGGSTHCGEKETFEITVYEIDHAAQQTAAEEEEEEVGVFQAVVEGDMA